MRVLQQRKVKPEEYEAARYARSVGITGKVLTLQGKKVPVFLRQTQNEGDFNTAILAYSNAFPGQLLGFAGLYTGLGNSTFTRLNQNLWELRMLRVSPEYMGAGLGKFLLEQVQVVARHANKTLVLEPKRPAEGALASQRDHFYPLSSQDLREFYKRHGFREFNTEERETYIAQLDNERFTSYLWFEGINPSTRELTEGRRHTMSREDAMSLDRIPLIDKIGLVEIKIGKYNREQWQRLNREKVEKYLIEDRGTA